MTAQPSLCQTWSETPKTGFLKTRLICNMKSDCDFQVRNDLMSKEYDSVDQRIVQLLNQCWDGDLQHQSNSAVNDITLIKMLIQLNFMYHLVQSE